MTRPRLDIVIPARGEEGVIGACLAALLDGADDLDLQVVVSANGLGWEHTLATADAASAELCRRGVDVRLIGDAGPGKPGAMNRADAIRRGEAVVYLDADAILEPGALASMSSALEETSPRLVAPIMVIRRPRTLAARHYARLWSQLPAVAGEVIGGGCFAVNPAGRGRWGAFPDLMADDAFVRSRFSRAERLVCPGAGFLVTFPEWPHLAHAVRRWRDGNRQLRGVQSTAPGVANSDPRAPPLGNAVFLLRRPDLWPSLPWFMLVKFASYAATPSSRQGEWTPVRPR